MLAQFAVVATAIAAVAADTSVDKTACTPPLDVTYVHGANIYATFVNGPSGPAQRWVQPDTVSWGLDSRHLTAILQRTRPSFIVEVGSWKGLSAIAMGHWLKLGNATSCATILCVDTWLGTTKAWTHRGAFGNTLYNNAGYPSIFFQWLFNIKHAGLDDVVVPLPLPSTMGALYLAQNKLSPDLVFIDACHDYPCVYADILNWFPVLRRGGVLFGDDAGQAPVKSALADATKKLGVTYSIVGRYFLIEKA